MLKKQDDREKIKLYILLSIVIFVFVILFKFYLFNNFNNHNNNLIKDYKFESFIKGCGSPNENVKKSVTRNNYKEKEKKPTIIMKDNKIIYERSLNHLCCKKVNLTYEIINNTINIYENWRGVGCKCICFTYIKGELTGVLDKEWKVNAYEKNIENNKTILIISKKVK